MPVKIIFFQNALSRAASVGRFGVDVHCAFAIGAEVDGFGIGSPHWIPLASGSKGKTHFSFPRQVEDPDITGSLTGQQLCRDTLAVRRDRWIEIAIKLSNKTSRLSIPRKPHQPPPSLFAARLVDEGTAV